jgi:general L-amino acid transport system permease protein
MVLLSMSIATEAIDTKVRRRRGLSLSRLRPRAILWQALVLAILIGIGFWLVSNTLSNLEIRRINSGWGFLQRPASMPIGETLIAYTPGDSNRRAVMVGLLNTLLVSVLGIILSTILGVAIGVSRLSKNWLLARLASIYLEFVRNIPLLAHLLLVYVLLQGLPPLRSAFSLGQFVFLSNRGLIIPSLTMTGEGWPGLLALAVAAVLIFLGYRFATWRQRTTGRRPIVWPWALTLLAGLPAATLLIQGASISMTLPRLSGFNFIGGYTLSPELTALLFGLVIYTAAFIAEIVRGSILAVSQGQWEAGYAIGLDRRRVLRLIVLPQALRLIIPSATNQYLDLAKSSSLAIAIGYPDLVAVINGIITDTGQAIECVAMIMGAFLVVSLSISALMNWYNAKMKLVER